ncbi:MAG TPA: lytic transglycosylase domain-containing protein [Elusimicrobiota bacterium]|nr:lytic transglycosylase domain-containing protein [Elusimicrobiota bacterium]
MKTETATPAALLVLLSSILAARVLARDVRRPQPPPPASPPAAATLPAPSCALQRKHARGGDGRYDDVIIRHARRQGLNPNLVKAVIAVESQFKPTALSHCGARGLMQLMPATAKDFGVKACDLWDPETNISVGTSYLAYLYKIARKRAAPGAAGEALTTRRVIAAYYSGPGAIEASEWSGATRSYVRAVLDCYAPASETATLAPRTEAVAEASVNVAAEEEVW